MNTHAPTPWHAVISRNGLPHVVDDHNGLNQLTIVESPKSHQDHETDAANCIFITRAVNSHDALLAALRECVTEEGAAGLQEGLGRMKRRILAINDIARAAIAQATGNAIPAPAVSENLNQPL